MTTHRTHADEMAEILGMALAATSVRSFGFRAPSPDALARADLARKCRAMIRHGESPWVTFHHLIKAGVVTLTKRRNKPPLLRIAKKPRRLFT